MKKRNILSTIGALLALSQAQIALAKIAVKPCIEQADVVDGVIYAMPSVISAFQARCGQSLSTDGYMKTQAAKLSSTYLAQQQAAWPGARRFLLQLTADNEASSDDGMIGIIASLPSDAVRPFVDALVQQEVAKKIPVKDCANIERGVSLLAPLPPRNVGGLASFIFQMADVKDPMICENE